jgi:hypothetical protein
MSAYSGAFGVNGGYNQSGGAYYITLSSVVGQAKAYSGGSGSGGATTVGAFTTFANYGAGNTSSLIGANKVIKDMGKTVVSAARTFRKFQAVAVQSVSTGGVMGPTGTAPDAGYLTFYLELNKDGLAADGALIARYA